MNNPIHALHALGQSIWYDNIERRLLTNGALAGMVAAGEIRGVTSNPSIFHNAIARSADYDDALLPLARAGMTSEAIYESLAIADIQAATDLFRPLYESSGGADGYVSLEVSPHLAHDSDATCREARRLWDQVARPNLMVKIPATAAGLPAIRKSISAGLNINVTLIFSQGRYREVMEAYILGLEDRQARGEPLAHVASVASFFVSRIDSKVDGWLQADGRPDALHLRGRLAIANARLAYRLSTEVFSSPRFRRLEAAGARAQRPLWASTSTKNPAYRDVLYVENLIGAGTVNTVPPQTLDAFRDHGKVALTIEEGIDQAEQDFSAFASLGFSFAEATAQLEAEGVKAFADAYTALLEAIDQRRRAAA